MIMKAFAVVSSDSVKDSVSSGLMVSAVVAVLVMFAVMSVSPFVSELGSSASVVSLCSLALL